jgi:4a-hydroxytetrahydrobiopterin dehydratase
MSEAGATPITPESLASERSADIPAGTAPLSPDEAGSLAAGVAGEWQINKGEIRREFTFKTFNAAFGMATRIALLAEAQGHHPELEVGWGRLVVRLSTHSVGGLSRNDFIMAARIDRLTTG